MRKKSGDQLAADEEKNLQDKRAAVASPSILADVSNFSWLYIILDLIEDLQTEIEVEIPLEQVGSSETVQSATKSNQCLVTLIADLQK